MTDDERKSLAEQLTANPLYEELLQTIETDAMESLVYADTETKRLEAQWRVRASRAFREDCEEFLRSKPTRKGAPA